MVAEVMPSVAASRRALLLRRAVRLFLATLINTSRWRLVRRHTSILRYVFLFGLLPAAWPFSCAVHPRPERWQKARARANQAPEIFAGAAPADAARSFTAWLPSSLVELQCFIPTMHGTAHAEAGLRALAAGHPGRIETGSSPRRGVNWGLIGTS